MHNSKFIVRDSTILGIDPGYGRMGIAIIKKSGSVESLLYSECFETEASLPHADRLLAIGQKIKSTIETHSPDILAIETLLFSKNVKTALLVAEARGVILLEGARSGVQIEEYNPNQIKMAVTGYGKSDKKQIISMVQKLLKLDGKKRLDDEYDAIAIGLTCSAMSLSTKKF